MISQSESQPELCLSWLSLAKRTGMPPFIGLGTAVAAELLDPTVKDADELAAMQGFPVLGTISHIPDLDESPT